MMQLSLTDGLARKRDGLSSIERHHPSFVQLIRQEAIRMSNLFGSVTSDDLRIFAELNEFDAPHPNCWGAVFAGSSWRVIGHKKSVLVTNHHREIKIWRYRAR